MMALPPPAPIAICPAKPVVALKECAVIISARKRMFKKIICFLFSLAILFSSQMVLAVDNFSVVEAKSGTADYFGANRLEEVKGGTKSAPTQFFSDLPGAVGNVISAILVLSGTIFLVLTVYASILWLISQGNEEQIEKAKKILFASVIGLIITMSAYAIAYLVNLRAESLK